jgi:hypothetical protein
MAAQRINGVYVGNLERLLDVLQTRLRKVMEAHRFFEEHAQMRNRIGAANLNEALSHIGRLAESADDMTEEQQRDQVTHFEDHLRRTMMESFELVARARLGRLKQEGITTKYSRQVVPLLTRGKLPHVAPAGEMLALQRECRRLMEEGRKRKDHYSWEEWDYGAECLAEACEKADSLSTMMRESVGAAEAYRRERLMLTLGVVAVVLAVAGIVIALALAS